MDFATLASLLRAPTPVYTVSISSFSDFFSFSTLGNSYSESWISFLVICPISVASHYELFAALRLGRKGKYLCILLSSPKIIIHRLYCQ